MDNFILTFEYNEIEEKIEIHANEQGLKFLKKQIESLLKDKNNVHLMTKNWGGGELSEEKQGDVNKLINHVKVFYWE